MIRKLLFCVCMMMVVSAVRSQVYVDGNNINADTSVQYIEIVYEFYSSTFNIKSIDFGVKESVKFTDAAGKKIKLQTPVDLINYMKRNGWRMVRREMIFNGKAPDVPFSAILAFAIFERINTAPAH